MQVAELIETSFGPHLDPDGHIYIRQIRKAANNHRLVKWTFAAGEWISYPLNGFVWQEDHRVVANLSLIPFHWKRKWIFLIANVAVHPDYRQKGIAGTLTQHALEHLKKLRIDTVWLHVREENFIARHLYESFHFNERCRRDTWVSKEPYLPEKDPANVMIKNARHYRDWPCQEKMLDLFYPEEIRWHLSLNPSLMKPGILSALKRHLNGQQIVHFSAYFENELAAIATWESSFTYADPVTLAVHPGGEKAIPGLLSAVKQKQSPTRPLLINFPAGQLEVIFSRAGFERINRLVWMNLNLNKI
jgi:ribosomal protein S18 acetylase RimI-like enzyme